MNNTDREYRKVMNEQTRSGTEVNTEFPWTAISIMGALLALCIYLMMQMVTFVETTEYVLFTNEAGNVRVIDKSGWHFTYLNKVNRYKKSIFIKDTISIETNDGFHVVNKYHIRIDLNKETLPFVHSKYETHDNLVSSLKFVVKHKQNMQALKMDVDVVTRSIYSKVCQDLIDEHLTTNKIGTVALLITDTPSVYRNNMSGHLDNMDKTLNEIMNVKLLHSLMSDSMKKKVEDRMKDK